MTRKWINTTVIALALGVWVVGCSDQSTPPLAPDQAQFDKGGKSGSGTGGKHADATNAVQVTDGGVQRWKLAKGRYHKNLKNKDEKLIGSGGGYLYAAGHLLSVPAGSVSEPTEFKMAVTRPVSGDSSVVSVSLKAFRVTSAGDTVNVGKQGFNTPVNLYIYYGDADVADPSATRVLWIKEPGVVEPVAEFQLLSEYKWILGKLPHFSEYGIGWPNRCDEGC